MKFYSCKQCGRLFTYGYANEFDEYFCTKNCYEIYCGVHGYDVHKEYLREILSQ